MSSAVMPSIGLLFRIASTMKEIGSAFSGGSGASGNSRVSRPLRSSTFCCVM